MIDRILAVSINHTIERSELGRTMPPVDRAELVLAIAAAAARVLGTCLSSLIAELGAEVAHTILSQHRKETVQCAIDLGVDRAIASAIARETMLRLPEGLA